MLSPALVLLPWSSLLANPDVAELDKCPSFLFPAGPGTGWAQQEITRGLDRDRGLCACSTGCSCNSSVSSC